MERNADGGYLHNNNTSKGNDKLHRIEKSIVVDCPVKTCYNQWTQFEEFPKFMEGILQVEQLDEKRLHWVAEVAGDRKEWDAEIVDQVPDQLIAWRSTSGALNHGSVTFEKTEPGQCRVTVLMTYETHGLKEKIGDMLGILSARVEGDLRRFKEFIENRQRETGAWRGEIEKGRVRSHRENRGMQQPVGSGGLGSAGTGGSASGGSGLGSGTSGYGGGSTGLGGSGGSGMGGGSTGSGGLKKDPPGGSGY